MEKKGNKGIVISLLVVIAVLIGSITYMLFSGVLTFSTENKKDNKTEEKEGANKENVENKNDEDKASAPEEIDITLYEEVDKFINFGGNLFGVHEGIYESYVDLKMMFLTDDVTSESINDYDKLFITMILYGTEDFKYIGTNNDTTKVSTLDGDIVLQRINKIFGEDNGYKHINGASQTGCVYYKYNFNDNVYELYDNTSSCGGLTVSETDRKVVKTTKTSDSIVVTEKIYFVHGNEGVYKDFQFNQKIDDVYDQSNTDYYFENGATVTYTFKLSEDGTYYFDNSKITH